MATRLLSRILLGDAACDRTGRRRQLHSQCGEGHGGCLHGGNVFVRIRSERPHHPGFREPVPETIPACFRNPPRPAPARSLPRGSFSHAGRGLPYFSYARSAGVLQQGRHMGGPGQPAPMQPTYVVATLPGEKEPEFLLILPFTPRGKDNLIGWMAARCDGDRLGNLIYFQLSKQQLMYGPMQIESRIDQDQNISKDLSLWNQQGSHVLRGSIIALPVSGGFLYVESIYIQATEARMPQLK